MATGPVYKVAVEAFTNTSPGATDSFIEIQAVPAATTIRIIRMRFSMAQNPPAVEVTLKLGVYRKTSLATSGAILVGTNRFGATDPPPGSSVYIKTGAVSFAPAATAAGGTLWQNAMNMRTTYDWIAANDAEYLESAVGTGANPISLDISTLGTSLLLRAEVDFII